MFLFFKISHEQNILEEPKTKSRLIYWFTESVNCNSIWINLYSFVSV